jgi:hypothetical protein
MPTFLTLAKWTDEGIRNIKDSPKRRQAFEDRITSMGGKVKDAYLVMGEYDLVVVTEEANERRPRRWPSAPPCRGTYGPRQCEHSTGRRWTRSSEAYRRTRVPGTPYLRALTSRPPSDLARSYWERVAVGSIRE